MIHFDKIVEPPGFDERTRKQGLKWLGENMALEACVHIL